MNLYEKLLEMQKRVDSIIKDGRNDTQKYDFASDENVLDRFRPIMDDLGLLLFIEPTEVTVRECPTKSGTIHFFTEVDMQMRWVDVETKEELIKPWYSQGTDTMGEKGIGKALTYGEKYYLLKNFHVPTKKDDPDFSKRNKNGTPSIEGTEAERLNVEYFRKAIPQMISELCQGDEAKIRDSYIYFTKSDTRGYPGVDNIDAIKDAALAVMYGKLKKHYEKRMGKAFELRSDG